MQIGPYLWIRHWLEYEYGKEYFDALLEEVTSVHADPRTNEEYFCSELNKEQIAEVVYHEGKTFCFTRQGSNWFQAKAKSMQNGRTSEGKSPNGWFKLPRASSPEVGGIKHHRRINEATFDKEQIRLAALLIGWYGPNQTHSDELNRALDSPLRRGGIVSLVYAVISQSSVQDTYVDRNNAVTVAYLSSFSRKTRQNRSRSEFVEV
jgi:hypothetical protein